MSRERPRRLDAVLRHSRAAVRAAFGRDHEGASPVAGELPIDDTNHWTRTASLFEKVQRAGGVAVRPNYTWSLLHVAGICRALNIPRYTAIEFGVAGGNGLVALDVTSRHVSELTGVEVDVIGFDMGTGLPPATDWRDAPYLMAPGDFPMDVEKLRSKLRSARLILGPVGETVGGFLAEDRAPIGFIAFDLDYYSSTIDAFRVLEGPPGSLLPRVLSYFDDTLGYPWGDANGERRAIIDFNTAHPSRLIDQIHGLRHLLPISQFHARWTDAMYLVHVTDHPRYDEDEGVSLVRRLDLE
ncbi:MAG: hypothetical protein ACRDKS_08340 [Actinomycetota bacterium]